MRRTLAALGAAVALAVQVLVVTGTTPAAAYVGPGDDRQKATPTGWWWYTNVDASYINSKITANNARLTDISVFSASPLRFTVTMVSNTGSYATPLWWYYGVTAGTAQQYAVNNQARITVAKAYNTSSGIRYVVLMVKNTGAYAEAWWWYYGSVSYLSSKLSANQARLVGLSQRPDGTYLGVMARNTGNDATGWWWYVNATTTYISQKLAANKARIVDLNRNANGTWNVVMYSNPAGTYWWWYVGQSVGLLHDRALQLGARIIDVQPYVVNGVVYYAGVFVNNLDALSTKLREILRPKIPTGHYGFEMKLVGGPMYAGLQPTRQFEPASSLKVLYHLHSIRAQQAGTKLNSEPIVYHYKNLSDPNDKNICPADADPTTTTNLQNADTLMMQQSDNRMTRGILEEYGKPAILSTATSTVGTVGTAINHNIGCGSPHNYTTLEDLRKIYEGVQNKTLVTDTDGWNATFKSRMLNQSNTGWRSNTFCPVAQAEGASLGKSSSTITAFCNAATYYSKGGSYGYADGTVSWSSGSMTGIPFKSGGVLAPKFYYYGDWVDGTKITSDAMKTAISGARTQAYREALRSSIRSALLTWT